MLLQKIQVITTEPGDPAFAPRALCNDDYFGLVQEDRTDLFGEQKTKFKKASASNIKKNKAHILKLKRKYAEDMLEDL